jgi:O-antigen/teichoic acid export membrane protein
MHKTLLWLQEVIRRTKLRFRDSKLLQNSFFNGVGWLGGTLLNFIALPFIVKKMGLDVFGVYALIIAIMGYLGVMDLGIGQSIVKFVSEYHSQKYSSKVVETINNSITLLFISGFLGTLCILCCADYFPIFFNVPAEIVRDTRYAIICSSFVFLLTIVMSGLSSVLNGLQRFDITSKLMLAYNSSLVLFTVIVLYEGGSLSSVMLSNIGLLILFIAFVFRYIYILVPDYSFKFSLKIKSLKPLMHFGLFLAVSRISGIVFTQFDKLFIGSILGTAAVSYYAVPSRVMNSLLMGVASMGFAIMPKASEISLPEYQKEQSALYLKATRYFILFITPIFLIFILLSKRFMTIWMGGEFAEHSWLLMSLIAISYYLSASTNIAWNIAVGMGFSKLQAIFAVILTVISLGALYPMTVYWGIQGTALAVLSGSVIVPITFYYLNRYIFHIHQWIFLKKVFLVPIVSSVATTVVVLVISPWLPYTFFSLFILTALAVICYSGSYSVMNIFITMNE